MPPPAQRMDLPARPPSQRRSGGSPPIADGTAHSGNASCKRRSTKPRMMPQRMVPDLSKARALGHTHKYK
eukprot:15474895-Alexandrium_andersonii.AAC.1